MKYILYSICLIALLSTSGCIVPVGDRGGGGNWEHGGYGGARQHGDRGGNYDQGGHGGDQGGHR